MDRNLRRGQCGIDSFFWLVRKHLCKHLNYCLFLVYGLGKLTASSMKSGSKRHKVDPHVLVANNEEPIRSLLRVLYCRIGDKLPKVYFGTHLIFHISKFVTCFYFRPNCVRCLSMLLWQRRRKLAKNKFDCYRGDERRLRETLCGPAKSSRRLTSPRPLWMVSSHFTTFHLYHSSIRFSVAYVFAQVIKRMQHHV